MIDLHLLRNDPEALHRLLERKGPLPHWNRILQGEQKRRSELERLESLRGDRNRISEEVGRRKRSGDDASELMEQTRTLKEEIAHSEERLKNIETELEPLLLTVPNPPADEVPDGRDASSNQKVRSWGDPARLPFPGKPHWELGKELDLLDLERGVKVSGTSFFFLKGMGARLERALVQFMLDRHTRRHGYREVAPPLLVNEACMTGTGQLPKLAEDLYRLDERDRLYLIPTAEVPLTNLHREEILPAESLPLSYTAMTPCFRREAGAAGKATRGMLRVHQFHKVELVKFTRPEESDAELEKLTADAERILKELGLAYRVMLLCAGDLSFASRKTYDIEIWAPGIGEWLEVSSCSNFGDFQARRAGIRFKEKQGKPQYLHTLNGSGVALPRLMVALMETYQQKDGSIRIPEALVPFTDGTSAIRKAGS
jgi:seryl-tRNA synthetase